MLVRCPKHGRVYDDAAERGCPLCLQGAPGAKEEPKETGLSKAAVINLAVLGVLLAGGAAAYFLFLKKPPPPPAPQPVVIDTMALIDPGELYTDSTDRTPIRQARVYAANLERVYGERGALLRFSEGPVDTMVEARAERARARQYALLAGRWQSALEEAKPDSQRFYRPGVRWADEIQRVTNYLGAARVALRQAAPADQVIARTERERLLANARGYLSTARTVLSEMPGEPGRSRSRPATRRPRRR